MKCLKSLPMILKWQGLHEKHEGPSTDFGFWLGRDFMTSMKALLPFLDQWGLWEIKQGESLKSFPMILDWHGLHEKPEGSSADLGLFLDQWGFHRRKIHKRMKFLAMI